MSEGQKKITRWLLWGGYAIFLGVSIPHIAWVFRQYTPTSADWVENGLYWLLATGYAIAIDGVMAWLSHTQSQRKQAWSMDNFVTWGFIGALVGMSWYLNWVYDLAHDPSQTLNDAGINMGVWNHLLIWGKLDGFTVGAFTPTLLGALPVFTIAYVSVLNKVHAMEEQDAKSLTELEKDADEIERRKAAMERIKNAGKKQVNEEEVTGLERFTKRAIRSGKSVVGELVKVEDKPDPRLQKIVAFFVDTPELLNENNKPKALAIMKKELRLKDPNLLDAWYLRVQKIVLKKEGSLENEETLTVPLSTPTTTTLNTSANDPANLHEDGKNLAQNDHLTDSLIDVGNGKTLETEVQSEEEKLWKTGERITGKLEGQSEGASLENEEASNLHEDGKMTDPNLESSNVLQFPSEGKTLENPAAQLDLAGRRRPLSYSEAAKALNISERTVKNWKDNGLLASPKDDEKLITVASVKTVLQSRVSKKVAAK